MTSLPKLILPLAIIVALTGCQAISRAYLPSPTGQSDQEIAQMRAKVQALEDADYAIQRKRRQDAIDDLGTLYMKEAEAIKKASESATKSSHYIFH